MKSLIVASLLALVGCAASPAKEATIPVAVQCIPSDAPTLPQVGTNAELAAMSDHELILRIAAERLELLTYGRAADAVIRACR